MSALQILVTDGQTDRQTDGQISKLKGRFENFQTPLKRMCWALFCMCFDHRLFLGSY